MADSSSSDLFFGFSSVELPLEPVASVVSLPGVSLLVFTPPVVSSSLDFALSVFSPASPPSVLSFAVFVAGFFSPLVSSYYSDDSSSFFFWTSFC